MKKFVVLLAVLLATATPAAAQLPAQAAKAPAAAQARARVAQRTRVVARCTHLAVKPHKVIVTCADGGIYVVFRHYRSWTHAVALGRGVYWINDCKPSCAGGTFHHHRAHLRLGRVVRTRRGPVFSRLHVRWTTNGAVHRVGYPLPTRPI